MIQIDIKHGRTNVSLGKVYLEAIPTVEGVNWKVSQSPREDLTESESDEFKAQLDKVLKLLEDQMRSVFEEVTRHTLH